VTFKSQAGIRLALEICLEITGERIECFLLACKQAGLGILECRLRRRKIDTVKGKPPLDGSDFGRRRWWGVGLAR